MPFIEINGAQLYYNTYGTPGERPPLVLIHGSTVVGQSDWRLAAPLLAEYSYVIVPDCRGHGQSSNPNQSYSFAEMAADIAALIHQLGFEKAHIVGHSNGGNVALLVLMEHPHVVQTAILQAANAYVSADLIEKEPRLFDPERVRRERPAWMEEMIALHGPTHGPEYWRTLLRITMQEIISQPNYTPQELADVHFPVLVIQGENDSVNNTGRHAQYIAEHIPHAELWIPGGVGHNVHLEILFPWVERVLDFLARRSDEANDSLYRLARENYPDTRQTVFQVKAQREPQCIRLSGQVLTAEQVLAAKNALQELNRPVEDQDVSVLLDEASPWALVNRNVVDLRHEPRSLSPLESQGLLGEAVRILEERDEWVRVRMEQDGYLGWMPSAALFRCPAAYVAEYQASYQAMVSIDLLPAVEPDAPPGGLPRLPAGKLPFGVCLPVIAWDQEFATIHLPDSRVWSVPSAGLLPLDKRPSPNASGIAFTLNLLHSLVGTPYVWGGRSAFGIDCSGLAGAFLRFMGLNPRRDADQLFAAGTPVSGEPRPGDLLFFGKIDPAIPTGRIGNITHVAISLGGQLVLHASSTVGGVQRNSLDPDSPIFHPWLKKTLLAVRRLY